MCADYMPFNTPSWPVACVDWCDATAFCTAAGKHLCGRIGGGSLTPAEGNDAAESEWYRACSDAGANDYPYGDFYQGQTCNGLNSPTSGPVNVGFYSSCVNGLGVKDLSGNVREWEDACQVASVACAAAAG